MKCYECAHLKSDKLKSPCSECIGRPHDLCCSDNFEPIKRESAFQKWLLTISDSYHNDEYREGWNAAIDAVLNRGWYNVVGSGLCEPADNLKAIKELKEP